MTALGTLAAVSLWVAVGFVAYAAMAYTLLFYLPPAERLPNGVVADAVFVATVPFVLAVTWLAGVRD